jgi:hypothetical protein
VLAGLLLGAVEVHGAGALGFRHFGGESEQLEVENGDEVFQKALIYFSNFGFEIGV